jgi:hypothetical protein
MGLTMGVASARMRSFDMLGKTSENAAAILSAAYLDYAAFATPEYGAFMTTATAAERRQPRRLLSSIRQRRCGIDRFLNFLIINQQPISETHNSICVLGNIAFVGHDDDRLAFAAECLEDRENDLYGLFFLSSSPAMR